MSRDPFTGALKPMRGDSKAKAAAESSSSKASSRDPFTGKVKPMRSSSEAKKPEPAKVAPAKPAASGDFSAAEIAEGKARREKNAAAVASNPKAYAPKPAAKAAPAKKPVAKEVMVNKTSGAKFDMDKMRAAKADWESKHPSQGLKCGGKAYAKGGSVTRADGCATKGHTKGRMR